MKLASLVEDLGASEVVLEVEGASSGVEEVEVSFFLKGGMSDFSQPLIFKSTPYFRFGQHFA